MWPHFNVRYNTSIDVTGVDIHNKITSYQKDADHEEIRKWVVNKLTQSVSNIEGCRSVIIDPKSFGVYEVGNVMISCEELEYIVVGHLLRMYTKIEQYKGMYK